MNPEIMSAGHSEPSAALLPAGRRKLASVIGAASDVIKIKDVVVKLDTGRIVAAKLLSRWASQGWLRRVGTGAYVPAPLDLLGSRYVLEDLWVLVPALYGPAYIGGWTAAEHWGLTEQLFRDIVVVTARPVRKKHQLRHGAQFLLRHVHERKIFSTKTVWRSRSKVLVSDLHRTLVDMLDNPAMGGGIQHVSDCLDSYLKHSGCDLEALIACADRLGNGAVFKRLGFLAEQGPAGSTLVDACKTRLTSGNAKLDPSLECPRLVSRWRLWVPPSWKTRVACD